MYCVLEVNLQTGVLLNLGLFGNVYDFALDYVPLNGVKTIYDIHRDFMKKHGIV